MIIHLTDDEREALITILRGVVGKAFPRSPLEPLLMSVIRKLVDPVQAMQIRNSADALPGVRRLRQEPVEASTLKTVIVARSGTLSVTDHLAEMHSWLADRNIVPRELAIVHVLNFRIVFRAVFDTDDEADQFFQTFGYAGS